MTSSSTEERVKKFLMLESVLRGDSGLRDRVTALVGEHGDNVVLGVGSVVGLRDRVQVLEREARELLHVENVSSNGPSELWST